MTLCFPFTARHWLTNKHWQFSLKWKYSKRNEKCINTEQIWSTLNETTEKQQTREDAEQIKIKSTHHSLNTPTDSSQRIIINNRLWSCQDSPQGTLLLSGWNGHTGQGQEEADELVLWPMTWWKPEPAKVTSILPQTLLLYILQHYRFHTAMLGYMWYSVKPTTVPGASRVVKFSAAYWVGSFELTVKMFIYMKWCLYTIPMNRTPSIHYKSTIQHILQYFLVLNAALRCSQCLCNFLAAINISWKNKRLWVMCL